MTILVTGAAGFIGSHVVDRLLADGHAVVGIDNFNPFYSPAVKHANLAGALANPNFTLHKIDITDREQLNQVLISNSFDAIVHLAAQAGVRPSIKDPLLTQKNNIEGTYLLLELARRYNIKKIILASSSSVYGNQTKVPFSETDVVANPVSPYAATKLACEHIASTYHHVYGMETMCLRFFTVYGERGRPDMAPYLFTNAILNEKELSLYGDGTMERDFTYVGDIVNGIVACLQRTFTYEILNLGNSQPVKIKDLIATIERLSGKQAKIVRKPVPQGDVPRTFADISKAKRLLDWQPTTSLEEGMRRMIVWYKDQHVKPL